MESRTNLSFISVRTSKPIRIGKKERKRRVLLYLYFPSACSFVEAGTRKPLSECMVCSVAQLSIFFCPSKPKRQPLFVLLDTMRGRPQWVIETGGIYTYSVHDHMWWRQRREGDVDGTIASFHFAFFQPWGLSHFLTFSPFPIDPNSAGQDVGIRLMPTLLGNRIRRVIACAHRTLRLDAFEVPFLMCKMLDACIGVDVYNATHILTKAVHYVS